MKQLGVGVGQWIWDSLRGVNVTRTTDSRFKCQVPTNIAKRGAPLVIEPLIVNYPVRSHPSMLLFLPIDNKAFRTIYQRQTPGVTGPRLSKIAMAEKHFSLTWGTRTTDLRLIRPESYWCCQKRKWKEFRVSIDLKVQRWILAVLTERAVWIEWWLA